jgi:predicted nucleic acid-binding protein
MRVFVDTSYYVARMLPRDQWHRKACEAVRQEMSFVTSSLVIDETIAVLQARGFFPAAVTFLEEARRHAEIQIVYPDAGMQAEAWELFARWGSAGANAVDCVSFAIMRRFSIERAFTFDERFRLAGFETLG